MVVPVQIIEVTSLQLHPDNCPACEVKGNIVALEIQYKPHLKPGLRIRCGHCPECHIRSFSNIADAKEMPDLTGLDESLGKPFCDYRQQGVEIVCSLCRHMTRVLYDRGGERLCPVCTKYKDKHTAAVNKIYQEHENAT